MNPDTTSREDTMSTTTAGRLGVSSKVKSPGFTKFLEWAGVAAGIILVAFGVAAIVLGFNGKNTVVDSLKAEKIVGTPDMTPAAIKGEATAAGLKNVSLPSCSVAGQTVDTGARARCFASYMRIHALEATGGLTYAEMPRYATANGKGTNDPAQALKVNGQPQDNVARNVWVTETALSTALNTSYMADQLGNFGIVVGIALLLSGIGFIVLAVNALGAAIRPKQD
jgi:F0F1-type ATP synthase membrane subunit c/vacuolar-type H+-ATPase subunit K